MDRAEQALQDDIGGYYYDPLGYVLYAFPWGEGALANSDGPDTWQREELIELGKGLKRSAETGEPYRLAVSSGHGIGKTAFMSWVVLFFLSTRPGSKVVMTANTGTQLETKTWAEVGKWYKLAINKHWFEYTATRLYALEDKEGWFAHPATWSKDNTDAFQGTHSTGGVLYLFDEASGIHEKVWEVSEGAMTDPGSAWIVFGNPTQPTGAFRECFRDKAHRWRNRKVDSRHAKQTSKPLIQQWLEDYGEDSDFFRVRVRGEFPRQARTQLFPDDLVREAQLREPATYGARILAVDPARFGNNFSVAVLRQGDAILPTISKRPWERWGKTDLMTSARKVGEIIDHSRPDGVIVDDSGVGGGLVDALRDMGYRVIPVNGGQSSSDKTVWNNLRTEYYMKFRDALRTRLALPVDGQLEKELRAIEYDFDVRHRMVVEPKKSLVRRGEESPDILDAIAMTYAVPVKVGGARRDRLAAEYGTIC